MTRGPATTAATYSDRPLPAGTTPVLVWLRRDLRLDDQPALAAAAATGGPVVPVFIWTPEEDGDWPPGEAARWWLRRSLERFREDLAARGSRLILRRGPSAEALVTLAQEVGATSVTWNRLPEPAARDRDAQAARRLRAAGLHVGEYEGALLRPPEDLLTRAGTPFRVFTPFFRALQTVIPSPPHPAPTRLPPLPTWPAGLSLDDLGPAAARPPAPAYGDDPWEPGVAGAHRRLATFLGQGLATYARDRDLPEKDGTSRLSPHLHAGELGPRRLWQCVVDAGLPRGTGVAAARSADVKAVSTGAVASSVDVFLRELAWREFAHHLLIHFPQTTAGPLRPEFADFPWEEDPQGEAAWRAGRTGFPLVDAGMRQLLSSGWLHNRVRMVVASFLVKDLLVPWQHGARFFWERLVDADLANNSLGWQWVAGSGADAAPYFRVFNPVSQGERWDPRGSYVRRWIPELAEVPDRFVHRPWEAPQAVLARAGVRLGDDYPLPLLDHGAARRRALAAHAQMRAARREPS